MGATITVIGSEWISLDNSLPEVQKPCYFLDRENIFRGVMDESGDVYEILDNGTNDVVYHSNIEDGYIAFWKQELKMIENMEDKNISDKTRMKGMNQGIWLAVQELAHDGRWTQAAEELVSSCGLTEDECRKLQEESESFNDEMIKFIDNMFGRENMISEGSTISENDTICINIKYHKIGEVFNYKVGMSEMTLRVDKCDRCSGCAFENYIYDCVKPSCLGCEREDGESVKSTIVNT